MRSLTLDIALVFFSSSIALYLLSYKSHAKKAFLFSLLLFFSPVLLVIKESILSVFPAWVSILVLIVIGSIMLRYVFDLLFGDSASHIAGDLISTSIKYFFKMIVLIPQLILKNKLVHKSTISLGHMLKNIGKKLVTIVRLIARKFVGYFLVKKPVHPEDVKLIVKDDND